MASRLDELNDVGIAFEQELWSALAMAVVGLILGLAFAIYAFGDLVPRRWEWMLAPLAGAVGGPLLTKSAKRMAEARVRPPYLEISGRQAGMIRAGQWRFGLDKVEVRYQRWTSAFDSTLGDLTVRDSDTAVVLPFVRVDEEQLQELQERIEQARAWSHDRIGAEGDVPLTLRTTQALAMRKVEESAADDS